MSVAAEIAALDALRKRGVLTASEFAQAKKRIIAKI
jgi:hypothetical protein